MNMSQLENTTDTMLSQVWGFMHDIAEDFFIGYSDREKEGDWKWVDNSDLFWIHWDDQQPDGGTQENCAFMDMAPASGTTCPAESGENLTFLSALQIKFSVNHGM